MVGSGIFSCSKCYMKKFLAFLMMALLGLNSCAVLAQNESVNESIETVEPSQNAIKLAKIILAAVKLIEIPPRIAWAIFVRIFYFATGLTGEPLDLELFKFDVGGAKIGLSVLFTLFWYFFLLWILAKVLKGIGIFLWLLLLVAKLASGALSVLAGLI